MATCNLIDQLVTIVAFKNRQNQESFNQEESGLAPGAVEAMGANPVNPVEAVARGRPE
jgi:hypothetical protein